MDTLAVMGWAFYARALWEKGPQFGLDPEVSRKEWVEDVLQVKWEKSQGIEAEYSISQPEGSLMSKYTKTTFGELKRGDRFTLSESNRFENMKVDPAVLCESDIARFPFNAIALSDGRVRTFHENVTVFEIEV